MLREPIRATLYHVLGGVLLDCPSARLLAELAQSGLLANLAREAPDEAIAAGLKQMQRGLAAGEDAIRTDYAQLFSGLGKAKAPPWESVYLGVERLVWQEPAREVLARYAKLRLGYDDMKTVPPDHVGRELIFVATLAAQAMTRPEAGLDPELMTEQASFLDDHVLRWVPRFADDVRLHASTDFFRGLAVALRGLLQADRAWLAEIGADLAGSTPEQPASSPPGSPLA